MFWLLPEMHFNTKEKKFSTRQCLHVFDSLRVEIHVRVMGDKLGYLYLLSTKGYGQNN